MRLSFLHEAEATKTGKVDIIRVANKLENEIFPSINRLGKHIHGFKFHWPSPVSSSIRNDVIEIDVSAMAAGKMVAKETFRIGTGDNVPGKPKTKDEKWAEIMKKVDQATQSIPLFLAGTIYNVLTREKRAQQSQPVIWAMASKETRPENFPITPSGLRDLRLFFWHWAEDAVMKVIPGVKKVQ